MQINRLTMKKFITLSFLSLILSACSSQPDVAESMANPDVRVIDNRTEIIQGLDAAYCSMGGFAKFNESSRYYNFACKDGSTFRVPK